MHVNQREEKEEKLTRKWREKGEEGGIPWESLYGDDDDKNIIPAA